MAIFREGGTGSISPRGAHRVAKKPGCPLATLSTYRPSFHSFQPITPDNIKARALATRAWCGIRKHDTLRVARAFDKAARNYDAVASIQANIAKTLVRTASVSSPRNVLDISCGTGFMLAQAAERWPEAHLAGLDIAPAMLREAQRKIPHLTVLRADAGECELTQSFDLIFSCMMLRWFAQPAEMLRRWRRWLTLQGILHVAVPVAGSFGAWRALCDDTGVGHGVWPFPPPDFADSLAYGSVLRQHAMSYGSVFEFLRALKRSGGGTPRHDYEPISSANMRALVCMAPRPFCVSYTVLYAQITKSD